VQSGNYLKALNELAQQRWCASSTLKVQDVVKFDSKNVLGEAQ
jgi:hypothetical protein